MKKIVLALSLSLFLLVSACSAPATSAPVENIMPVATEMPVQPPQGKIPGTSFESQPYFNETVGFALDYPVNWLVQETVIGERGSQVMLMSAPELAEAVTVPAGQSRVSVMIYDWEPKNDLAAYVEKTKTAWEASGFTILDEQATILDLGLAAVLFTVQTPDATVSFLITVINDKYLVLSGEGDMTLVNEMLPRLRPISQ